MFRLTSSRYARIFALLFLVPVLLTGCQKDDDPDSSPDSDTGTAAIDTPPDPSSFDDGLTARQILDQSIQQYQRAEGYSDRAVLYLSYWMNGRPVQEPQPWAVSWHQSGKFSADFYNSQIRCDGERLSCYVYDISSANLDGQRLLLPARSDIPLSGLFGDAIARHFLGGESELPLNKTVINQSGGMIPPTPGLLTGQLTPQWLASPASLVRMADAKVDKRQCYVVRTMEAGMHKDVWIDKQSGIIRQIAFPVQWLDEQVQTAPEISKLQLVARFHEAKFNPEFEEGEFAVRQYNGSTPVSRFVKLPESIPADTIGQPAPPFEMESLAGEHVTPARFKGNTTALMWVGDWRSYAGIEKLERLKTELGADGFHVAVVFADDNLAMQDANSNSPNQQLAQLQQQTRLPFYFDRQLSASTLLKMKSVPAVVVLDQNSNVQFARELSDELWYDEVKAAMQRTAAGEEVGSEMLGNYRQFLDQYHSQFTTAIASQLGADLMPDSSSAPSAASSLVTKKLWTNDEFKMAGNMATTESGRTFVFDGWRTVVELDANGRTVQRYELDLPENEAASSIRTIVDSSSKMWSVVYMPSSSRAYLLDEQFDIVGSLPDQEYGSILDCRIAEVRPGNVQIAVAFAGDVGMQTVSVPRLQPTGSVAVAFDSIADDGRYGICQAAIINAEQGDAVSTTDNLAYSRILVSATGYVATAATENGNWQAVGLDANANRLWSVPVGDQLFETSVDPVSVSTSSSARALAIAGTSNSVDVVTPSGGAAGRLVVAEPVTGVSIQTIGDKTMLFVASEGSVSAWEVALPGSSGATTRPASHQQ